MDLVSGFSGKIPYLNVGVDLYVILGGGTFLKFFLWIYCSRISIAYKSDMLKALAEDHLNDVFSNSAAIATASIAFNTTLWWMDPIGAIVISALIIWRWGGVINEQVKKIVGYTAPSEYIDEVNMSVML
jgi:divalent metal cation (Fe/Co/Zn/Cd) transporter